MESYHFQNVPRHLIGMASSEFAHFLEEIQFDFLTAPLIHAGQTIGPQTDIHPRVAQPRERKGGMPEIRMASGTMDDRYFAARQQRNVAVGEIIRVNGQ